MYLIAPLTCFNRSVAFMVKGQEFDYFIDFESLQDIQVNLWISINKQSKTRTDVMLGLFHVISQNRWSRVGSNFWFCAWHQADLGGRVAPRANLASGVRSRSKQKNPIKRARNFVLAITCPLQVGATIPAVNRVLLDLGLTDFPFWDQTKHLKVRFGSPTAQNCW